ncbi:plasmid pRiA4b ORF-3 family protein [Marisediminicola senii]|uniref:plasmid pRiA4b ORF-3 family protein n=1 Tax=Marisediminicola senii TaxID=2711233 RepID=UPI0013EB26EE|nr:plasmid pRiA4b ORF-3 family protein [Marisediminicola senii]
MLRLRVSIVGIEPEIWRTIDVDESLSLAQLSDVLQVVFHWENVYLRRFTDDDPWVIRNGIPRVDGPVRAWGDPSRDYAIDGMQHYAGATVGEAMQHGGPLWYLYDESDEWVHFIEQLTRYDTAPEHAPAELIAGERRAPFDDCGGVGHHEKLATALANPSHPDHLAGVTWAARSAGRWGVVDPECPDLAGARAELARLFMPPSHDMSGLVGISRLTAGSPLVGLAAMLPVSARSNLRRHLHRDQIFPEPTLADSDEIARLVAPYQWLLDRVGFDGLRLTKAGWMPPAIVHDGMATLGWRYRGGGSYREELTPSIRTLRVSAERLNLVRAVRGRLIVGAATWEAIGRPAILATRIARMLLRQEMLDVRRKAGTLLTLGLADGGITVRSDAERHVVGALTEIGYADGECRPLQPKRFGALVAPVLDVLGTLGLWRTPAPPDDALRALARLALW